MARKESAGNTVSSASIAFLGGAFAIAARNAFVEKKKRKYHERTAELAIKAAADAHGQKRKAQKRAETLQELANRDPLTGLYNRRAFAGTLEGLATNHSNVRSNDSHPAATESTHMLLVADLDHFKAINDTFGHEVGDEVLKMTADVMNEHTRERDVVARLGGEEFGIILPRTDMQGAMVVAEKIRAHLESSGRVTASIGVATINTADLEGSIRQADAATYQAKHSGRNQIVQYQPGMPPVPAK